MWKLAMPLHLPLLCFERVSHPAPPESSAYPLHQPHPNLGSSFCILGIDRNWTDLELLVVNKEPLWIEPERPMGGARNNMRQESSQTWIVLFRIESPRIRKAYRYVPIFYWWSPLWWPKLSLQKSTLCDICDDLFGAGESDYKHQSYLDAYGTGICWTEISQESHM